MSVGIVVVRKNLSDDEEDSVDMDCVTDQPTQEDDGLQPMELDNNELHEMELHGMMDQDDEMEGLCEGMRRMASAEMFHETFFSGLMVDGFHRSPLFGGAKDSFQLLSRPNSVCYPHRPE